MERVALLVNPQAGRRRGDRVAAEAERHLAAAGIAVRPVRATDAAGARDEVAAMAARLDAVVVVGGDGAVHGVLPVLVEHDLALGLVPAGTGNDLARSLGLPVGDPTAAVAAVTTGVERRIDLADSDGALVATIVASGFDSLVNERAESMRWPRGSSRYTIALAAELRAFAPRRFTLQLDDDTIETEAMLVAVANGPSFGGGLRIAEGAALDDGLLDVCVIGPVTRRRLVRLYPLLRSGSHTRAAEFRRHRVRSVSVDAAGITAYGDGERLGPLPRTTRVRPGALRVLVPAPGP